MTEYLHLNALRGQHGVGLDDILPYVSPYEGMTDIQLPSTSTFAYQDDENDPAKGQMILSIPGSERQFKVDYQGYCKAMRLAGFPEAVVTKYPVKLMVDPLNWGFNNKLGETVKAFVKDDHLVAFVKPSLELVSTENLIRRVFEIAGHEHTLVERLDHNLSYTNCSMIVNKYSREWIDERLNSEYHPRKDVLIGGINFQNSIMGEAVLEVTGYIYRLICSSGLVSAEAKYKWSRKTESTTLTEWFDERVKACLEGLDHEFHKVDRMIATPIEAGHRADVLHNVFREYELSDKMRGAVLDRMTEMPPENMWDIVNAITNVANDEDYVDNPHTIRRLQVIGGDMSTKMHICNTCYSVSRTHNEVETTGLKHASNV